MRKRINPKSPIPLILCLTCSLFIVVFLAFQTDIPPHPKPEQPQLVISQKRSGIAGFWHINAHRYGKSIAAEQLKTFHTVATQSAKIRMLHVSIHPIQPNIKTNRQFTQWLGLDSATPITPLLLRFPTSFPSQQTEDQHPTLSLIQEFCHNNPTFFTFYVHNLGATKTSSKMDDWRHLLEFFVIQNPDICYNALKHNFDTCGVNYHCLGESYPHYYGNFWWASCSHINSFPESYDDFLDSHKSEVDNIDILANYWATQGKQHHPFCVFESGIDHEHQHYPREYYEKSGIGQDCSNCSRVDS